MADGSANTTSGIDALLPSGGKCRRCKKPLPPRTPKRKHQKYCSNKCRLQAFFDRQISKEVKRRGDLKRKREQREAARVLREKAKRNRKPAALPETSKRKPAGRTKK
jgi:hypothetical protein